jgi:hypothetical protein
MRNHDLMTPVRLRSIGGHRDASEAEQKVMLEEYIQAGQARAAETIDGIFSALPQDYVARARDVRFDVGMDERPDDLVITVPDVPTGTRTMTLHANALEQACDRAGAPEAYIRGLATSGPWGRELAARNLNELLGNRVKPEARFLVRSVGTQARAVLSDSYRRLDSRPLVEGLVTEVEKRGAVIVDAVTSDVRIAVRAMLPTLFQPVAGEVVVFGVNFANSDFGCGAVELSSYMLRVWCVNAATTEDVLRHVHLGRRLPDDLAFSQRTYELDSQTMASAVSDMTGKLLEPARIEALVGKIRTAAGTTIDAKAALVGLKKELSKAEVDRVAEAFNSPDVEMLPAGNTAWRFSNALSWVARQMEDQRRRLELEGIAGRVLDVKAA